MHALDPFIDDLTTPMGMSTEYHTGVEFYCVSLIAQRKNEPTYLTAN